jgi:hypothetical protein
MGALKTIAIFLVIFILIAVIVIVLGIVFFSKLPSGVQSLFNNPQQSSLKINYTSLTLDSRDSLGNEIDTKYILKQGDSKIASGEIFPGRVETFNQIIRNVTYDLYTYSNDYYLGYVQCDSYMSVCQTTNDKIGGMSLSVNQLSSSQYQLTLTIENGTIRNPVWCFAWTPNIYYVTMPIGSFSVPNYLSKKQDRCYVEDSPQSSTFSRLMDISFYSQVNNDRIEITVYDLVQYMDENNILREELMNGNEDLGTKNTQATISFAG